MGNIDGETLRRMVNDELQRYDSPMSRLLLAPRSSLPVLLGASALVAAAACGSSSGTGTGGSTSSTTSTSHSSTSSSSTGLPAGECRGPTDCMSGEACGVAFLPAYCGGKCDMTIQGDCMSDADCADAGADAICGTPCNCPMGGAQPQNHCAPGCAQDTDCGPSYVCDPTHRCVSAPCTTAADCSANFSCFSGNCTPKSCTSDAQCDGYCVDSLCSSVLGTCAPEVP